MKYYQISYPRSGANWLRYICRTLLGIDKDYLQEDNHNDTYIKTHSLPIEGSSNFMNKKDAGRDFNKRYDEHKKYSRKQYDSVRPLVNKTYDLKYHQQNIDVEKWNQTMIQYCPQEIKPYIEMFL